LAQITITFRLSGFLHQLTHFNCAHYRCQSGTTQVDSFLQIAPSISYLYGHYFLPKTWLSNILVPVRHVAAIRNLITHPLHFLNGRKHIYGCELGEEEENNAIF
jgi:hypothetical protein